MTRFDCYEDQRDHETHACDGCAKAFANGIGYAAGIVRECIGVPGQTGAQRSTLQALAKWLDGLSAAHEPGAMAEMRAEVEAIWSKRAKP